MDENHLSTTHEDSSVARVYVANGAVLGNVILFSGYIEALGEVTCAFLTDTHLDIGDCCVGSVDATNMDISNHFGHTFVIWMKDIRMHLRKKID